LIIRHRLYLEVNIMTGKPIPGHAGVAMTGGGVTDASVATILPRRAGRK
jgi:hypothetical protein